MPEYKGLYSSFIPIQPAPELREFIDFYYQGESSANAGAESRHKKLNINAVFLPVGCVEMTINYHDTSVRVKNKNKILSSAAVIFGPHCLQNICMADNFSNVNKSFHIRFKPHGFYRLFGIYQIELRNTFFAIDEVLGKEGKELEERLNNSISLEERVNIINFFFIYKKNKSKQIKILTAPQIVTDLIGNYGSRIRAGLFSKELCISERTLRWEFSHHIGLTIKEYLRICRFRKILNEMLSSSYISSSIEKTKAFQKESSGKTHKKDGTIVSPINWSEIIESGGYYDQAHLVNEFKEATTLTPDLFVKGIGKSHVKSINLILFLKPLSFASEEVSAIREDFLLIDKASRRL